MNRIITILVTIFILLLLYIWISHVWGSDSTKRPRQIVDARETETLGADDPYEDSSLLADSDMPEDDPYADEEGMGAMSNEEVAVQTEPEPEPAKKAVTEEKKPEPAKPEPKPVTKTKTETVPAPAVKTSQPVKKTTPATTTVESSGDGKHLVIVGNFLQRVNAEQRMAELKKAGFSNIEIVNFDLSEYHAVSAGRFDDVNEARRLVKKLKDYHKIDAYVRIGS